MTPGIVLTSAVLFLLLYGRLPAGMPAVCAAGFCVACFLLRKRAGHSHGGMLSIDLYAQRSGLNGWHAGVKLCFAAACAFICVAARPVAVALFLFAVMTALTIFAGRTPVRFYVSLLLVPAIFIVLSGLALLIEITESPQGLLDIPAGGRYLSVTAHGQAAAFAVMVKAMGAVSCLYMLSLSTPVYRIIAALRRAGLPSVVVELMYLIYRYLFILLEAYRNMVAASSARLGYRSPGASLKTMLHGALNLFFISLRRASDSFAAMESRCYDGDILFYMKPQRVCRPQAVATVALLAATAGVWAASGGMV